MRYTEERRLTFNMPDEFNWFIQVKKELVEKEGAIKVQMTPETRTIIITDQWSEIPKPDLSQPTNTLETIEEIIEARNAIWTARLKTIENIIESDFFKR